MYSRVILEPAGALAVAGLKKHIDEHSISGSTFVAITSGANMDFNRLRVVSERADDSERSLEITIPETPGAFRAMYGKIWPRNVTELTYRYNTEQEANVFVSFQPLIHVENDFEKVMEDFREDDFECTDLSDNELAKTHIRHLAGGRSNAPYERLFRFHFPEVRLAASALYHTHFLYPNCVVSSPILNAHQYYYLFLLPCMYLVSRSIAEIPGVS